MHRAERLDPPCDLAKSSFMAAVKKLGPEWEAHPEKLILLVPVALWDEAFAISRVFGCTVLPVPSALLKEPFAWAVVGTGIYAESCISVPPYGR